MTKLLTIVSEPNERMPFSGLAHNTLPLSLSLCFLDLLARVRGCSRSKVLIKGGATEKSN